jgi:hypothetical protein
MGNYSFTRINEFLIFSSKEISRLTEYISFGILVANFAKHECIHPILLISSSLLAVVVLWLHFKHYKDIYDLSDKALEKATNKKNIRVDFTDLRQLFKWKTRLLYINIIIFLLVGVNVFFSAFFQKIVNCLFS